MSSFRNFGLTHINLENVCYVNFNEDSVDVIFNNGIELTLCGKDKIDFENTLLWMEQYGKR